MLIQKLYSLNVGTIPSPNIINNHNPEFGPPVPTPPPPKVEAQNGKTINEILSETIQKLRRDSIEQNVRIAKLEQTNKTVTEEKERLRVLLHQRNQRIERLESKTISTVEKRQIVRDMLAETKFTPVKHSTFTLKQYHIRLGLDFVN